MFHLSKGQAVDFILRVPGMRWMQLKNTVVLKVDI